MSSAFDSDYGLSVPAPGSGLVAGPDFSGDLEQEARQGLIAELRQHLLANLPKEWVKRLGEQAMRVQLLRMAEEVIGTLGVALPEEDLHQAVEESLDEVFGWGPIEPLINDHEVSDILINGPRQIFYEKRGKLHKSAASFFDEAHLLSVLRRVLRPTGRALDEVARMVDARLPDGSRINVVLKPPATNGPLVSIRRFGLRPLQVEDLLANGMLTGTMLEFLKACVVARINIMISGGTGSGKTTLLNSLSRFIPVTERLVTIEDTSELELQQPHVAKLEAIPPAPDGTGEITLRELVRNALRMRPDRIIVGECRGAETLEMLQTMNTGHDGSMTTIHANSSREAVSRLELMIGMSDIEITDWAIRKLIASSIHLVIQVSRLPGGIRRIVRISEITGLERETISMHDLFEFVQTGVDGEGAVAGFFRATGLRPTFLKRLQVQGLNVSTQLFAEGAL